MRFPSTTRILGARARNARPGLAPRRRRHDARGDVPFTPAPAPAAPAPAPAVATRPAATASADELRAERRMREAGGPEDTAHYMCACGFRFDAAVSTTVTCPHCGTGQAW
ncbi:MAG TPA: hypothetical protein VD931_05710 [Baekduia sp.]|nr:hypothetical protein [Baekduia sp.]